MLNDNITQADVQDLIQDLLKFNGTPTSDPVAFSAAAIKAQSVQAILTGYQVQATIRLAEATENAAQSLSTIADHFLNAGDATDIFVEKLEGIRKAITSNG